MKDIKNSKSFKGFAVVLSGLVVASSLFTFSLTGSAVTTSNPDTSVSNTANFNTDVIYQIVTDRFKDGNSSNNATGSIYDKSNARKYHGGDWAGITQEINANYFSNMGVSALWISSPVDNIDCLDSSSGNDTAAYMGYWAKDFYTANRFFGTESDFQNMISAAHAKNIKVCIDFAPNHTSTADDGTMVFPYAGGLYQNGTLLGTWNNDSQGLFNHEQWINNWGSLEECTYHSLFGLADLNQMNSTVDSYLKGSINKWLDLGVDGIRVDAVKHMSQGWQTNWLSSIYSHKPVFTFGEWSWDHGDPSTSQMNYYANNSGMNLLDFRFDRALRYAFTGGYSDNGTWVPQDFKNLDAAVSSTASDYNHVNNEVTFIDNHDMERFDTIINNNHNYVNEAYVLQMTSRGIPAIYYGSEQYLAGGTDPANRADMPSFDTSSTAYQVISKLAPLHKTNPAIAYGTTTQRWLNGDVYIYERKFGSNVVLTAVNKGSTDYTLSGLYTSLPAGTYYDVLGGLLGGGNISVASTGLVSNGQYVLRAGQAAVWQYTSSSYSAPTIGNVGPYMAKPGNTVTIDGRDFGTTAGSVYFGTTAATVQSWGDSEIKVTVPSVASDTCNVTVKNASGTSSAAFANFKVLSGTQAAVRFKVNNATTYSEQNVYLVGSCSEIGNWDTTKAIGPMFNNTASIAMYPTWFYDVSVPAGTTISYKFVKKDASGNVTWESGSNHTYTVPSSGTGEVTVDWQN